MSEFDTIAATATAEAAAPSPGAEVEGQGAEGTTTAAGGDNPGGPGPIPYDRFRTVNERLQQATGQLEQYQPFAGVLQAAHELGITPEQFRSMLQQQAQASQPPQVDPQAQLREYITEHGQDPDFLTPEQARRWERNFQRDQQLETLFANQQQAQVVGGFERSLATVEATFPVFKDNPELKEALLAATWAHDQTGRKMPEIAATMNTALERMMSSRLAQYAADKQADAAVPVVNGGGSPAPAGPVPDWFSMNRQEQDEYAAEYFRQRQTAQLR